MNNATTLSKIETISYLSEPLPLDPSRSLEIDRSMSVPILFLMRSSFFSFALGLFLVLICSMKLVFPSFLDGISFLTYGRLFPVAYDLFIYGWAIPLGFALILWLMARLSATPLSHVKIVTAAAHLWNSALFLGSLAVLAGYGTSVTFLEYPNWASFLLFVSFLLMGLWVLLLIKDREERPLYISEWYLLTALCSFPWIYGTANLMLTWGKIQGSAQGPIQCWYAGSLMQFWLTPVALGAIYYLIPKITGVKIYSYYLALFGFFSLLLFSGWNGLSALIGGPIPAWMMSAGVVTSMMLVLPMIAVVVNFYKMFQESEKLILHQSPALRFVAAGIISYVIATALSLVSSFPCCNAILNFTDYLSGTYLLFFLGFFGMTLFGGLYYFIPRLTGISWSSSKLIRFHFWLFVVGISLMVSSMVLGGIIEGIALNDPVITFTNILSYTAPWNVLVSLSWSILLLGFFCFMRLLVIMRWQMIEEKLPLSL
jgi:cytochrome c oxidase cbb3-type subunit 1